MVYSEPVIEKLAKAYPNVNRNNRILRFDSFVASRIKLAALARFGIAASFCM